MSKHQVNDMSKHQVNDRSKHQVNDRSKHQVNDMSKCSAILIIYHLKHQNRKTIL